MAESTNPSASLARLGIPNPCNAVAVSLDPRIPCTILKNFAQGPSCFCPKAVTCRLKIPLETVTFGVDCSDTPLPCWNVVRAFGLFLLLDEKTSMALKHTQVSSSDWLIGAAALKPS